MENFFFIVTHINITEVMQLLNTYITLFPMLTVLWMYTAIVNMENYTYFLVDASILISNFTMRLIYPVAVHLIDFNHIPSLPPTENENVMEGEDHFFEYVGNFFYAIFIY